LLTKTKTQIGEIQLEGLQALINTAGTKAHLAKMLDIDSMVVHGWCSRGRVSKKGVVMIEHHPNLSLHFTRDMLRPDM